MNNETIDRPFIMTNSSSSVNNIELQENITDDCINYYLGTYNIPVINYYTATFVNYDGTVLDTQKIKEGNIPIYTKAIPTKPSDDKYNYKFYIWDNAFEPMTKDITYTALYNYTYKEMSEKVGYIKFMADDQEIETIESNVGFKYNLNDNKPLCKLDDCSYEFVSWDKDYVTITEEGQEVVVNGIYKKREKTFTVVENYDEFVVALNGDSEQIIVEGDINVEAPIIIDRDVEILGYYYQWVGGYIDDYLIYINNDSKKINVEFNNMNLGSYQKGLYVGNNANVTLYDCYASGIISPYVVAGTLNLVTDYVYYEYNGKPGYHFITIDPDYKESAVVTSKSSIKKVEVDNNIYYDTVEFDYSKDYYTVTIVSNVFATNIIHVKKNTYYEVFERNFYGNVLVGNYSDKEYKNKISNKILVDKDITIYQLYDLRYFMDEYELYDREDRGTYDDERDLISLVVGKVKNYNNLLNRERTIYTYSVPAIDCRCGSTDPNYVETEFDYYDDYDNKCRSKVLDVKVKGIGYISNGKVTEQYVDEFTTTDKSFKLTGNVKNKDGYYKVPGTFKYKVTITFNSQSFDYDTNEVEFYYDKNGNKEVFTATFDFVF